MPLNKFAIPVSTALPGNAEVRVIFSSVDAYGAKQMRHLNVKRHSFGVNNDQNATLAAQESRDGGTTWRTYDSRALTAPAANTINGPFDYITDVYEDWRLVWTNGATPQTVYEPMMFGHEVREPGT